MSRVVLHIQSLSPIEIYFIRSILLFLIIFQSLHCLMSFNIILEFI